MWGLRTLLSGTLADPVCGFKNGEFTEDVNSLNTVVVQKSVEFHQAIFLLHLRSPPRLHAGHISLSRETGQR